MAETSGGSQRTCLSCHSTIVTAARFCPNCGNAAPAAAVEAPSDPVREVLKVALGRQYSIQGLLGRGGMGAVYLATETALERDVAIKVLPPDRGATQDSRDRFRREARTAARLSHPNIVPLHTFGDVDGTLYFVMGYVRGESLATRLKREGRLAIEEARRILIEICDALDYAHKLGIVHRDIKPDNVLIEEETGRALLLDFGVAKAVGAGQTLTEVGSVLGTPQYMSPEQAQGKSDIDSRSDLYSLGVMGYAMISGRLPFEGATPGDVMAQHITKDAPALKALVPDVAPEIASALGRCLEKDPSRRWPDAKSLKDSIEVREGDIPEEILGLRRDCQFLALGLYASALLAFRSTTLIPDPEAFQVPWEGVYAVTALLGLAVLNSFRLRVREGRSWGETLRLALSKPDWWVGSYPSRLRLPGDVWTRLPADLRRARAFLWAALVLWALWIPPQMLYFSGLDAYLKKGVKNPAQMFFERAPRFFGGPLIASVGLGMLGSMAMAFFSAARWGRSPEVNSRSRHLTNAMFLRDTAHRTFWTRPEVASLLRVEATMDRVRSSPTSPRGLVAAIDIATRGLTGAASEAGGRARAAAVRMEAVLAALDAEIRSLSAGADAGEAERLASRIEAMGPAQSSEGEARRQMRGLLEKQLELLRGVESRLETLQARRARQIDLLTSLWQRTEQLAFSLGDPPKAEGVVASIEALCHAAVAEQNQGETQDLDAVGSDAPTVERGPT